MAESSKVEGRLFASFDNPGVPSARRGINATEGKTEKAFDKVLGFFGHSRNIYVKDGNQIITVNRASAKKFISRHLDTFTAQVGGTDVNSITDDQIEKFIQHLRQVESTQATVAKPPEVGEQEHGSRPPTEVEMRPRERNVKKPATEADLQTFRNLGIEDEMSIFAENVSLQERSEAYGRFKEKMQALYRLLPPRSSTKPPTTPSTKPPIKLQDLLRADINALHQLEDELYDQFDPEGANERGLEVLRLVCKGDEAAIATQRGRLADQPRYIKKKIVLEFEQRFSQLVTTQWEDYWTNSPPNEKPVGFSSDWAQQQVLQGISNDCFKKFRSFYLKKEP